MAIIGGLKVGQLGVGLLVKDVAVAAAFYRDVLGAEEISRETLSEPTHGLAKGTLTNVEMLVGDIFLSVSRENPGWSKAPRPDHPRAARSLSSEVA